jgi:hypothetical protein
MKSLAPYVENGPELRERFLRWWRREPTDRPLIRVTAPREKPLADTTAPAKRPPPEKYLDADYLIARYRDSFARTWFGGEAFPLCMADLGPGSLALYLGAKPGFAPSTIWFEPSVPSLESTPLPEFDPRNAWFQTHLELLGRLHDAFGDVAYTAIPDLVESLDIVAALRGPQPLLYDLLDQPDHCHRWISRVNALYAPCYDIFYNRLKDREGGSAFTAFHIWSPGKTAKIQCDFSAMISPEMFGEFYIPYAKKQIESLDYVLYHLDGPACIGHVDQLIALDKLNCIQWVPGDGQAPQQDERWFPLYRKILDGGKGLQVRLQADKVVEFVKRFGSRGVYIITGTKTEAQGRELMRTLNAKALK